MPADAVTEEDAALLTAHALGVLDAEEALLADRLIASSEACAALFEEALETAALLAVAVEEVAPDPALRERILDAIRRERGD
ncbi:MAG: hypothetical protein ACKVUT_17880 [Gaiella sp.]